MTDQDPTQRYEVTPPEAAPAPEPTLTPAPPAPPAPEPAVPLAPPPPPGAATAAASPPAGEVVAAPTEPVAAAKAPRRGGRLKWLVAGAVTLLVAGSAAGATWLLTRDSGSPAVMDWAPADSILYAELRLDLPGSQQAELASVMSAFPGFDDQAAFEVKLGEALDQLMGRATDGKHDYQTWIEPWFGGQLSMSMGPVPTTPDPEAVRALLLASVTDAAKAAEWAGSLVADSGATTSMESYEGVTVMSVTPPDGRAKGMTLAYAIVGPVLALGDVNSVKASIATGGDGALAKQEDFSAALGSVPGDRLAFAYMDTAALLEASKTLAGAAGDALPMGELPAFMTAEPAPWTAVALRADDDAFVVDTRMPHVGPLTPATASTLPAVAPPTTVLLGAWTDVGTSLEGLRASAADDPALGDGLKQVEDALAIIGGFDAIVGWMDDAGVAITRDGDTVAGGLLVTPTDAADADRLLTQLKGFIALAGATSGIKVADEDYAGTTITTITIEDVGALAGMATGGAGPDDLPDTIEIAYAVTDEVVTIGYTAEFVKAVVDARTGDSLATTDRFKSMLDRAGSPWSTLAWVDVDGLRGLVEGMVPAAERGVYDTDLKPYLEAFDAMIATSVPAEDLDRGTMILRAGGE